MEDKSSGDNVRRFDFSAAGHPDRCQINNARGTLGALQAFTNSGKFAQNLFRKKNIFNKLSFGDSFPANFIHRYSAREV